MRHSLTGKNKQVKKCISFPVDDFNDFKIQMLNWVNRFNIFCFLDNQHYDFSEPAFECLLAAGCKRSIEVNAGKAFEALQNFYATNKGEWLFGHFGYDLKNETERLNSRHTDNIAFSDLHFFVPEIILQLNSIEVKIYCNSGAEEIYRDIRTYPAVITEAVKTTASVKHRIDNLIHNYCSSKKVYPVNPILKYRSNF